MKANLADVVQRLENLEPGQSIVYHTGITGSFFKGMDHIEVAEAISYFTHAQDTGQWDFVQRKIMCHPTGLGVYQYIATRRFTPYEREVL